MIRLENIFKSSHALQKGIFSLNNININFNLNQIYNLVGDFHSGNRDLLLVVGLIDDFVAGSYYFNNQDIGKLSDKKKAKIRAKNFGIVLDKPLFINTLTILENIILPLNFKKIPLDNKKDIAIKLLNKYNLEDLADLYPSNLSYYQQQVISLIRAQVNNPNFILIDNVFKGMNNIEIDEYLQYLKDLKEDNKTIMIVSDEKITAIEIDQVIYMDKGRVLEDAN